VYHDVAAIPVPAEPNQLSRQEGFKVGGRINTMITIRKLQENDPRFTFFS
jgi:hypothetical protein